MRLLRIVSTAVFVLVTSFASADERLARVATYNIKFLDANKLPEETGRTERLHEVLALLDADVIGLQEIRDTAALRTIFPASEWQVLIDEDSGGRQDVAIAVRRPFRIKGSAANDIDADDDDFLFPAAADDSAFPNRRDVLFAEIEVPDTDETVHVFVIHAKARVGGRAATDPRRERAAVALVDAFEHRFHEKNLIVLGDFNDNPDDRSTNILETGDPNARGGLATGAGTFLVNLTEDLVALDHVSHGRTTNDIRGDRVDTIDPGSRERNNALRGTNQHTGDILFDQILISPTLIDNYRAGSVRVFDHAVAVEGNSVTRASDHLPVYAEFSFAADVAGEVPPPAGVRIIRLLPDPDGEDQGRETVTLRNDGAAAVNLGGWVLRDRANNEFALSGITVPARGEREIRMTTFAMPLNNSGDDVLLVNASGAVVHRVTYSRAAVAPGVPVSFP